MIKKITIAICTYNRAEYITYCLDSILKQPQNILLSTEVLIIDNNSTDNTSNVVNKYSHLFPNYRYINESNIGLSFARNRALKEASNEWVIFVDDDAILKNNYIERTLWIINNYKFDMFGGMYYPYYLTEKPKWISNSFGMKEKLLDKIGILQNGYITGVNMVVKKSLILKIGGFPTNLGMKEKQMGYGEEDYVQLKLKESNYIIGFDPDLIVNHIVLPHKLKLLWHIKMPFAFGVAIGKINCDLSILKLLLLFSRSLFGSIYKLFKLGIKVLVNKNYYFNNYIIDVLFYPLYNFGKLKNKINNLFNPN